MGFGHQRAAHGLAHLAESGVLIAGSPETTDEDEVRFWRRLTWSYEALSRAKGIPVSVCGEMAGDIHVVPILLGLGIVDLSMSAPSIPEVKSVIRAITLADAEKLVEQVLRMPTAGEVKTAVEHYLDSIGIPR